jgi:hypothetical protein
MLTRIKIPRPPDLVLVGKLLHKETYINYRRFVIKRNAERLFFGRIAILNESDCGGRMAAAMAAQDIPFSIHEKALMDTNGSHGMLQI